MATVAFLAMTSAEIAEKPPLPAPIGWMSCHFSPDGTGLCDLPEDLPKGSLLILDDSRPMAGHGQDLIAQQLNERVTALGCCAVLLDFQRPGNACCADLAAHLAKVLPCPVVVSHLYAGNLSGPVLLPPVPPSVPLKDYLTLWKGRDIWLETGLDGEQILLTEQGSTVTPLPRFTPPDMGHCDETLHCHYKIEVNEDVRFTLWRTTEDLRALTEEAEALGVAGVVGLYQELHGLYRSKASPA